MRRTRLSTAAGILALALALTACGGAASPAARPATGAAIGGDGLVTVRGTDAMKFEPARLTARVGQPLQLAFQNAGQVQHNITIRKGSAQPVHVVVAPGRTEQATLTFGQAGTYEFACDEPGHTEAGMKGTILVQ